ncbi:MULTISPECIES: DNA mismatch repair protein MutS [unclassified Gemella]|uniref:DNA mismatch repair protein MutS n=1 Tax=unclassified Gemella TaxID=2624949 RepID=UPI001073DBD7|nr:MULTISPECIES: DNA mismatch repair protein MutS [unclassified Gemella]MBF0710101.1 DNA mismatch repair protein MutS [Gemella sp. GL1.1]MBF0746180.1 DNA mismatch repair protein MutS [Gemella sp. 19428wG2_WT2a]NYS27445.1 DNA mismatch repair protein MutS [Gemella sp. GL1]TFU60465.1 DNA mismatch repair protein MutS [Gemella sp. WT2a]
MKYTPMIEQYLEIKKEYEDCFLFYRLGDFYEMFFEDAIKASKILEITLTGREAGGEEKIPMCGVPFHSSASYIDVLVNSGYKVAICEQVTPAKQGKIVERKVVRVVTPGTYMYYKNLDENNYLGAIYKNNDYYLSFVDIMTGDAKSIVFATLEEVLDEISKKNIKEILNLDNALKKLNQIYLTTKNIDVNLEYFNTKNISNKYQKLVCNNLLKYIEDTQAIDVNNIKDFEIYSKDRYLYMTNYSLKNLEISQNMSTSSKKGSLLSVIDKTKTSAGSRKIKFWLENPLVNLDKINKRQKVVSDFISHYFERIEIQNALRDVYDLERISTKLAYNIITPKELLNLKNTIKKIPEIKSILQTISSDNIDELNQGLDSLSDLNEFLQISINEQAGNTIKEGNVIKKNYNEDLDRYRHAKENASRMLLEVEQKEKKRTGIKNLKIGYNKIFGYYIEITKTSLKDLDTDALGYIRKQTLSNNERYISEELKKIEEYILNSSSNIEELEVSLFQEVKERVKKYIPDLQKLADKLSELDVYIALANVAEEYNYVRPSFNFNKIVDIKEARHPIVERMVRSDTYVSNDCKFSKKDNILLITGPNMSGKSTYMRQLALIVILAQIGSYVPCSKANLPIFDKIFTRIGASDDLAGGKSTFMVEMIEAKKALVESTKDSLLIFDEIGRGTSTYDGIALAQAILEYINKKIGCKTLFSTHYHELTKLENIEQGIRNIHVTAKEENGRLFFLYKVKYGAIEKSYGIHVAQLAELPSEIIENANNILIDLEQGNVRNILPNKKIEKKEETENKTYTKLSFDLDNDSELEKYGEVEKILSNIDLLNTTPLQAINILGKLKDNLNKR